MIAFIPDAASQRAERERGVAGAGGGAPAQVKR
jgi:hypothetical protein